MNKIRRNNRRLKTFLFHYYFPYHSKFKKKQTKKNKNNKKQNKTKQNKTKNTPSFKIYSWNEGGLKLFLFQKYGPMVNVVGYKVYNVLITRVVVHRITLSTVHYFRLGEKKKEQINWENI